SLAHAFVFASRRRHTRLVSDWSTDVCSSDLCDSRRSLILAYVTGVAGPGRIAEARRHLATCPGCASWARELRTTVERAAVLVPRSEERRVGKEGRFRLRAEAAVDSRE